MTDTGYLITRQASPNRADWKTYTAWCARHGLPRVSVTKATYWKVECDAGTLLTGRYDDATLAALERIARPFLEGAPSNAPRIKAIPGRVVVYGLARVEARRLAGMIVDRFPPLADYRDPYDWSAPPLTPKPAPSSLLDRVRSSAPSNVVDLARYRKRRRPNDTDVFGLPTRKPRTPWENGPA